MSKDIELINLCKTYSDGTEALASCNLKVRAGEFASIVGPSGCGKSTLLNLITGLEDISSGEILFSGQTNRPKAGEIACVFQEATLLPWTSIRKNIELPMTLQKKSDSNHIDELIHMVGLQEFSNSYPDQLSGGMKMRASIARAYASKPDILLLDEPFASLDELNRNKMGRELLRYHRQMECTTLFITHHIQEAIYLSDQVHVMSSRPGTIQKTFQVDKKLKENEQFQLSPEFINLTQEITACIQVDTHV